jgi:predicted RNA-binding Zn-ribbon protein involved in translation (DUF1610 family)
MLISNTETILEEKGKFELSLSFSLDTDKPINIEEFWSKIHKSITSILHKRFTEASKRKIKPHSDRLSFACPYCGDSHNDPHKKRGNVFFDSVNYHCFNGDCNAHNSLFFLLKEHGEIDNYTASEKAYMKETSADSNANHTIKKIRIYQSIESLFSDDAMNLTVSREFFLSKLKLQEIRGSRIQRYLDQRFQTKYENFAFEPKKGQLYVLNLTSDGQRVIGFQIKTFNKRSPYLTHKTSLMHKHLGIYKEENAELLEKMDTISTVFGIMNLDLSRNITVFEGPLDSFLFPNSVGVCSAKNDFPFDVDDLRYFYDNDATGKDWAMRKLQDGFPVFLWKKFIEENELSLHESKIKDLNDLLIMIKRHSLKVQKFAKYFSTDKYDMIWI